MIYLEWSQINPDLVNLRSNPLLPKSHDLEIQDIFFKD